MSALKPGDFEAVVSEGGCFDKAIDVTAPIPNGTETLEQISALVADGLGALGGDHPPAGGGPSSPFANTWSYLKAHIPGASVLPDLTFNFALVSFFGLTPDGKAEPRSDQAAATLHRRRSLVVRDPRSSARSAHGADRGCGATIRALPVERESCHPIRESVRRATVSRPVVRRTAARHAERCRTRGRT